MEKIIFIIKDTTNFVLELLFPSRCIGCNIRGEILCLNCINKLQSAERETEKDIIALYDYRDSLVKKTIWKLKYHHTPYLGQKLGQLLYESMIEEIENIHIFTKGAPIYVIPVPISKNRKNNRGYNQSEIIAKSFCKSGRKEVLLFKNNIIFKNKNTIPQAKLTNRSKRLKKYSRSI